MMINPKNQHFLIQYGPDHFRDTHIQNSPAGYEKSSLFKSHFLSKKNQHDIFDKGGSAPMKLVRNASNLDDSIIDKFMDDSDSLFVKPTILENPKSSPHALSRLIDHPSFNEYDVGDLMGHPSFNANHQEQLKKRFPESL